MVVRRVVVAEELQLVRLDLRVRLHGSVDHLGLHVPEPGDVLLPQVAQAPEVAALDDAQQVQGVHGLAVPVQVRQHQKPFVAVPTQRGPVDDVLDLLAALDDIVDPVQPPLLPARRHERPHAVAVDRRRLRHEPEPLPAVLLDVLFRARAYEVQLEVGELVFLFLFVSLAS